MCKDMGTLVIEDPEKRDYDVKGNCSEKRKYAVGLFSFG